MNVANVRGEMSVYVLKIQQTVASTKEHFSYDTLKSLLNSFHNGLIYYGINILSPKS